MTMPWAVDKKAASQGLSWFVSFQGVLSLCGGLIAWLMTFALYEKGAGPEVMASALFAQTAPRIYLGAWAGALADRWGQGRVLKGSLAALCLLYTLLGCGFCALESGQMTGVLMTGALEGGFFIGLVLAAQGLLATVSAFYDVSFSAALSVYVAQIAEMQGQSARYDKLYSWLEISCSSANFIAPVCGGFLAPFVSLGSAFCLGACVSGGALLVFGALGAIARPHAREDRRNGPYEALRFIAQTVLLRDLLAYFAGLNLLNGLAGGLILLYVLTCCGGEPAAVGLFSLWVSFGAFLGGVLTLQRMIRHPLWLIVGSGVLSALCGRVFFGLSHSLVFLAIWAGCRIALAPLANTANQILWSERTPLAQKGSVFGVRRVLAQGGYPLGILAGGFLYTLSQQFFDTGLGVFIGIMGVAELILVLFLAWRVWGSGEIKGAPI